MRGAFSVDFENNETAVVTGSMKVGMRVCSEDPEAVMLPACSLDCNAAAHVPDADALIL
jgi:hypothetical protein